MATPLFAELTPKKVKKPSGKVTGYPMPEGVSVRDLYRLRDFYQKQIRQQPAPDLQGVLRQMQRLLEHVSIGQMARALENYKDYECEPHFRLHIRRFFTLPVIQQWQHPHPKAPAPAIGRLNRLESHAAPTETPPSRLVPTYTPEPEPDAV